MQDDLETGIEGPDPAGPSPFARVFVAGERGGESRRDAVALRMALAAGAETVTVGEDADLLVTGATDEVEGARCPVAVAPRGLAERGGYELRRIDVGIDGGRGAAAALAVAGRLALAHDARLRAIAIAAPGSALDGVARQADPREVERLAGRLEHATAALTGVWAETELREGPVARVIVDFARQADLLVLGSRAGYGNAGRVVLGEVAARVLGAAACPTLIVPAP
ncbi:MAG TPA: universal stress protein [Solirubrobacterales bacterium]|nr:universal stress protein [Solirubrobacterales bacterium]